MEQDFHHYIKESSLVTKSYDAADWVYIPIYWQRHCFANDYYTEEQGLSRIQEFAAQAFADTTKRYFTVSSMDNGPLGSPRRRQFMARAVIFNGCMGDEELDLPFIYPIPLLTSERRVKGNISRGRYLASFIGRKDTHPSRARLFELLEERDDVLVVDGYADDYAKVVAESAVSLCPRGNGLNSYRFYESMQLGVVPVLIADRDIRPFPKWIPWDEVSFYVREPDELDEILACTRDVLIEMGRKSKEVYSEYLSYGKWCRFVIATLEGITSAEPSGAE